jgi:hypothetical protein
VNFTIQPPYPWEKKRSIVIEQGVRLSRYGFLGEETAFPLLGFELRVVLIYYYYYYY